MNIAIIGYGRMGREIAAAAVARGHSIGLIVDVDNTGDLNPETMKNIDVAIEFSSPVSAVANITSCFDSKIPVVAGTTGWLEKWEEVTAHCIKTGSGFFYASNYSIGVNILFAINTRLAELMKSFPAYDVSIEEVHHVHKLDAPSGTAITLAGQITKHLTSKKIWALENGNSENIYIDARREGEVNGFHKVIYESPVDTISISHNAKSRIGFATGAVLAAEYMQGKTGVHSMKEMLNL